MPRLVWNRCGWRGGVEPLTLPAGGRVRLSRAVAGRLRAGCLHYASAHSGRSRNSSLRSSDNHARFPPWADPCTPLVCVRSLRPLRGRDRLFGGVFFRPRASLCSALGGAVRGGPLRPRCFASCGALRVPNGAREPRGEPGRLGRTPWGENRKTTFFRLRGPRREVTLSLKFFLPSSRYHPRINPLYSDSYTDSVASNLGFVGCHPSSIFSRFGRKLDALGKLATCWLAKRLSFVERAVAHCRRFVVGSF